MASACISTCVNDIARAPVRATYINLYKWPESDAEFIKSVSKRMNHVNTDGSINHQPKPKVVDSISCRQLYLRSYTFSREENVNEKTVLNCYGKVKDGVNGKGRRRKKKARNIAGSNNSSGGRRSSRRKRKAGFRRAKEISCAALASIFRRLLSCTTKVDVVG